MREMLISKWDSMNDNERRTICRTRLLFNPEDAYNASKKCLNKLPKYVIEALKYYDEAEVYYEKATTHPHIISSKELLEMVFKDEEQPKIEKIVPIVDNKRVTSKEISMKAGCSQNEIFNIIRILGGQIFPKKEQSLTTNRLINTYIVDDAQKIIEKAITYYAPKRANQKFILDNIEKEKKIMEMLDINRDKYQSFMKIYFAYKQIDMRVLDSRMRRIYDVANSVDIIDKYREVN